MRRVDLEQEVGAEAVEHGGHLSVLFGRVGGGPGVESAQGRVEVGGNRTLAGIDQPRAFKGGKAGQAVDHDFGARHVQRAEQAEQGALL